jgi:hypothetical protein
MLAEGLSNERVCFKGMVKTGINELMAVAHRRGNSPYKLHSGMLGIITEKVINKQTLNEQYM